MKKTIAVLLIVVCLLSLNMVYATTEEVHIDAEPKKEMDQKKAEYTEKYDSEAYWFAGYIIEEIVQPYSIPLCILGIIIGLAFQYVMGTRRLDYKHRGFGTVIIFVTILLICQVLPFIYALVVKGWGG